MRRWMPLVIGLAVLLAGCPRRDQPPESSYDPELLETAKELAAEQDQTDQAAVSDQGEAEKKGECSRETGGCPAGYLCWDSWYCKQGRDDQCSAMGDKRCHKLCFDDGDCPRAMPLCREKPIFKGSDRGRLERFCVANDE